MFNEKKFEFDIDNLKKDLAIENIYVTDEDVNMLREYSQKQITMNDMINNIKNSIIQGT